MEEAVPDMPVSDATVRRMTRRKFLRRSAGALGAAATGTFLYTWRLEPHWVEIVRRPLPIDGLPAALLGKRLVQISDIHVGPIVDQSYLLGAAEKVAELQPDLLAITGDFMTSHRDEQTPRALDVIRALPPAPLGRLAILGNHDYGRHHAHRDVGDKLTDGLERLDVQVLRNDVVDIGGLQVAGVDDLWSGDFRPEGTLAKLDAARPSLALCHNPDGVDHAAWRSYRGWILAGHTHGGQCKAPFFQPPIVPVFNKRYVAGEYDLGVGRRLYINRGLGYLHRVRFNCRPEITVFTLERTAT
jgi:predicted MPP superfamily phosphohydrolase